VEKNDRKCGFLIMYCFNCGEKIPSESKFCRYCGVSVGHTAHHDDKISENTEDINRREYSLGNNQVIPIWQFLLLNLITFGLYQVYWGWKYWEIIKRVKNTSLSSGWRGFFIVFTSFSLFPQVLQLAKSSGYKGNFSAGLLATIFLIVNFINNGLSRAENLDWASLLVLTAIMIGIASLVAMPVINAMNYYLTHNNEGQNTFDIKPNFLLIAVMLVVAGFYILSGFYSETNTSY